jgi:hypothetical protein
MTYVVIALGYFLVEMPKGMYAGHQANTPVRTGTAPTNAHIVLVANAKPTNASPTRILTILSVSPTLHVISCTLC